MGERVIYIDVLPNNVLLLIYVFFLLMSLILHIVLYVRYKGPDRHKLYGPVLDRLHAKCMTEQRAFLENTSGYGRAITGDGATILGTKFINFLCHEHEKGVMLCRIKDCTERQAEVGSIQSTFIAHEMISAIRYV